MSSFIILIITLISCGNQSNGVSRSSKSASKQINRPPKSDEGKKKFNDSFKISLKTSDKKGLNEDSIKSEEGAEKVYWGYFDNIEIDANNNVDINFDKISYDNLGNKMYVDSGIDKDDEGNIKDSSSIDFNTLDEGIYELIISEKQDGEDVNESYDSNALSKAFIYIHFFNKPYFQNKISSQEKVTIKDRHLIIPSSEEFSQEDISTELTSINFMKGLEKDKTLYNINNEEIKISEYINKGFDSMLVIYKKVIEYDGKKYYSDKMLQIIKLEK